MTTPNEGVVHLGVIGDTHYVFIEDGVEIPDQPEEINFREVVLTKEQREELRTVGFAAFKKERLRESIEVDVGDLHDLVADCMKLIEYNTLLSVRLAADYLGVDSMSDDVKETYKNRVAGFLGMLDSGGLIIRGDFEDVDEMLGRLLARYSKIQEKTRDDYIEHLKSVGL